MLIIFDVNHEFFFAVFLALFNIIPYIGVFIPSEVVVLNSLAPTRSLFYPVAILISLWIQLLENNLITPYVVGSQVELNPLVALIAIFAGVFI